MVENDPNYNIQLTTEKHVVWTRDGGTTEGGQNSYKLPATDDIEDGHTIHFHSFQKHTTQDGVGGTIHLEMQNGQSISTNSTDHPNIVSPQYNQIYFRYTDRSTFVAHFDKPNEKWYMRCISDTRQTQLNTPYIFHFDKTSASYSTEANALVLPRFHSIYYISVGDSMAYDANVDHP